MKQLANNRRFSGIILAIALMVPFIIISIHVNCFFHGSLWFLFSSVLRAVFGIAILYLAPKLYNRPVREILRLNNSKAALVASAGFLVYFLLYVIVLTVGIKAITGLTSGLFFTKIILQQITTGFYEELNFRFLICEGYFHGEQTIKRRLIYGFLSFLIFGALHVVTGWNTYRFFLTGTVGLSFAAMFLCSRNIVVPMIMHAVYDIAANLESFIEWDQSVLTNVNSYFEVVVIIMFVVSLAMLIRRQDSPLNE